MDQENLASGVTFIYLKKKKGSNQAPVDKYQMEGAREGVIFGSNQHTLLIRRGGGKGKLEK